MRRDFRPNISIGLSATAESFARHAREMRTEVRANFGELEDWPISLRQASMRTGISPTGLSNYMRTGEGLGMDKIRLLAEVLIAAEPERKP